MTLKTGTIVGATINAAMASDNVYNKQLLPPLMDAQERRVYDNSAYVSQQKLMHDKAPQTKCFMNEHVRKRKDSKGNEAKRTKNRNKSRIRVRTEHVFAVDKRRLWGFYRSSLSRLNQEYEAHFHDTNLSEYLPGTLSVDGTGSIMMGEKGW